MHRRALLAPPALVPALAPATSRVVLEEHIVPARDARIQLHVRNKRPKGAVPARPDRMMLMANGIHVERDRGALFNAVQSSPEEEAAA